MGDMTGMDWSAALLPVVSLVLGAGLSHWTEYRRHHRTRREALEDGLRAQRGASYSEFLEAAHHAAHVLGRMTPGCPNPLASDAEAYWHIDADVTKSLRRLELVATPVVRARAGELRRALLDFRTATEGGGIVYGTDDYWAAHTPVSVARDCLVTAARRELLAELAEAGKEAGPS